MKKGIFYTILVFTFLVISLYIFLGIKFGQGVEKFGKDLLKVQREWKKNKDEPLDTINDLMVKKMDSLNLELFYFKGNKLFPFRINCKSIQSEMFKNDIKYAKIKDGEYIERFIKELKKLKTEKEQNEIDVRMQIIFHNGKIKDTICMGSHFGIKINGVTKEDSKSFFRLIQEKTYE